MLRSLPVGNLSLHKKINDNRPGALGNTPTAYPSSPHTEEPLGQHCFSLHPSFPEPVVPTVPDGTVCVCLCAGMLAWKERVGCMLPSPSSGKLHGSSLILHHKLTAVLVLSPPMQPLFPRSDPSTVGGGGGSTSPASVSPHLCTTAQIYAGVSLSNACFSCSISLSF